jgi:Skp family chaperone for outer membrane proteins
MQNRNGLDMKVRTVILGCLIGVVVLSVAYEYSIAAAKSESSPSSKMGVVSVRQVFLDCKRSLKYKTEIMAEQSKLKAELDDMEKEIESEEAELKTLKSGTAEYLTQIKTVLEKRAKLQAQQEFVKQQLSTKDKQWTEELFKDVLTAAKELAQQKGLDIVFERTEPEFPISSEELRMVMSTYKILYSGGCVDLTKEVVARLDAK